MLQFANVFDQNEKKKRQYKDILIFFDSSEFDKWARVPDPVIAFKFALTMAFNIQFLPHGHRT